MIQGIQLELSGNELAIHLFERVDHHNVRAGFYDQQVAAMIQGAPEVEREEEQSYSGMVDPVHQMKLKARDHRKKRELFRFMAEHILLGETYRITEQDLLRLEFLEM